MKQKRTERSRVRVAKRTGREPAMASASKPTAIACTANTNGRSVAGRGEQTSCGPVGFDANCTHRTRRVRSPFGWYTLRPKTLEDGIEAGLVGDFDFGEHVDAAKEERSLLRLTAEMAWYQEAASDYWWQAAEGVEGAAERAERMRTIARILLATISAHATDDERALNALATAAKAHIEENKLEDLGVPGKEAAETTLRRIAQDFIVAAAQLEAPGERERLAAGAQGDELDLITKLQLSEPKYLSERIGKALIAGLQRRATRFVRAELKADIDDHDTLEAVQTAIYDRLLSCKPEQSHTQVARLVVRAALRPMGMPDGRLHNLHSHENRWDDARVEALPADVPLSWSVSRLLDLVRSRGRLPVKG